MKASYKTKDEIPAQFTDEYEEKDGLFVLRVDGELPGSGAELDKARQSITQFRDTNSALLAGIARLAGVERVKDIGSPFQELEARVQELSKVDPEQYQKAMAELESFRKKGIGNPGDIDTKLEALERLVKEERDARLRSDKARQEADAQVARAALRNQIGARAQKANVRADALDYIRSRARGITRKRTRRNRLLWTSGCRTQ